MSRKSSAAEMHERILKSALEVFSAKGYSAATIRDISNRAGCNTVTVFRHFEDKMGLFLQVVEHYHEFKFDAEDLNHKLSYLNLHGDFRIMADYIFDLMYQNIHILRIFINDGHEFGPISKYLWFVPEDLKIFVSGYLESMYPDKLSAADISTITEMFLCYIIRTCLRTNVHDGVEETSRQTAKEAREIMAPGVDMVVSMIMRLVRKE
ncbi:MAG: TetR/AcrR family transcriptional regulator [Clostridiales bacterium]|nr:TetR/AcrR family transcriptional regulator [Clostridiales bacterium]MCD8111069.1 TetR/AcrR family transcriptional regulator [Clostridiales bacterium]MCD8133325.1 TetR/AcrR family transcriptional regulator [Clostridiales bacterium]